MYNEKKIINKLKLEADREISPEDMQKIKNKYKLWQKMHPGEFNCNHCIFNLYKCHNANKHYMRSADEYWYCLGFLQEGNYVK